MRFLSLFLCLFISVGLLICIPAQAEDEAPVIEGDSTRLTVNKAYYDFGEPIIVSGVGSGIEQLRSDHYDRVYIIGHSLGEADYAVFDAINKDAKVLYYYHYENEYLKKSQLLGDLNLEYEMIKDTELYK